MHGGRVEARSEGQGRGSEFIVRLPTVAAKQADAAGSPPGETNSRAARPKYRIVVADDNEDAAESLAMLLRMLGHDPQVVHDGLQAVEEAAAGKPDVVLLDIGMPNLNGYDACRRIRALPGGKDIFLVALTGWGQEEDRQRSREAGFDEHLTKPADPAVLEKLLALWAGPRSE